MDIRGAETDIRWAGSPSYFVVSTQKSARTVFASHSQTSHDLAIKTKTNTLCPKCFFVMPGTGQYSPAGHRIRHDVFIARHQSLLRSSGTQCGSTSGFTLSYRDVEDVLAERGRGISYETVRRWVLKFGPLFARRRPRPTPRWHLDELAGEQFWL
jgi:hypothetical protein